MSKKLKLMLEAVKGNSVKRDRQLHQGTEQACWQ
jgi:hypothetical protein